MATKILIPRFLLPRQTPLWQHALRNSSNPSKTPSPQPFILAKPEKFNPPSHGSKLRQPGGPKITNYGAPLTAPELAAQSSKQYPNSMPPPGTFLHWFLHNKYIHVWISLSTLSTLAFYSFYMSYKTDEEFMRKYGDMLPRLSDVFYHPIGFFRGIMEVVRLRGEEKSAETKARRERSMEDVRKREEYRKAHGLNTDGFGGWSYKGDEEEKVEEKAQEGILVADVVNVVEEAQKEEEPQQRKKSRYNFLGIF